ncbi:MAG: peptidoglycan bridge formation glycyltransferase FemA/FemB family protein [bacterium]
MNLDNYDSVLQTKEWSDFKANFGWRQHQISKVWILQKKIALGRSVLYIPEVTKEALLELDIDKVKELAKRTNAIFLKIEPIVESTDKQTNSFLEKNKFIKSFEELQPSSRNMLDISDTQEKILKKMKPKGRYNVSLAEKKGIKITSGISTRELKNFYKLFVETSKRDKFTPRAKIYFQKMLATFEKKKIGEVYLAYFEHQPLAAIIATFQGSTATYLYGASSSEHRNLMAPYLLHWHIIKDAKRKNCTIYDLLAVSPKNVKKHKYDGITEFKEKFGGRHIELIGSYDLIFAPWLYKTYKIIERQRRGL